MLDAAATGLPLIVSNTVGEAERVKGSGRMYVENDVHSLADARQKLCGHQRVSSQLEEVVMDIHTLDFAYLGPEPYQ